MRGKGHPASAQACFGMLQDGAYRKGGVPVEATSGVFRPANGSLQQCLDGQGEAVCAGAAEIVVPPLKHSMQITVQMSTAYRTAGREPAKPSPATLTCG